MSDYRKKAEELFLEGYNCAQAVFCAFADEIGIEEEIALKLSSSFGGGMGRMREVCGAVSGMFMALGALRGYSSPDDNNEKKELYSKVQKLAEEFKKENGSIICRELLGGGASQTPTPSERTPEFYKKRPCKEYVGIAAEVLAKHLGFEE